MGVARGGVRLAVGVAGGGVRLAVGVAGGGVGLAVGVAGGGVGLADERLACNRVCGQQMWEWPNIMQYA